MSAELYTAAGAAGSNASAAGTTLGGSKPIHRFIRGQPKAIGTAVLIMGMSFFIYITSVAMKESQDLLTPILPSFLLGSLYITTGILYIVTEHNPTKKTVTISLALTIVTILGICWTLLDNVSNIVVYYHYYYESTTYLYMHDYGENVTDNIWTSHCEAMGLSMESVIVCHNLVGVIIMIVMTTLAVTALRSTNSQAIVVMTAVANETPVE